MPVMALRMEAPMKLRAMSRPKAMPRNSSSWIQTGLVLRYVCIAPLRLNCTFAARPGRKQCKISLHSTKEPTLVKIGSIQLPDFPLLLAPMEDVSDPPFRAVCKSAGADLMYTEFISSEGLIRDAIKSRQKLDIFENERPVGIQIFGGDEEAMALAARIVDTTGPDLLDINFGCPVKKVVTKG